MIIYKNTIFNKINTYFVINRRVNPQIRNL